MPSKTPPRCSARLTNSRTPPKASNSKKIGTNPSQVFTFPLNNTHPPSNSGQNPSQFFTFTLDDNPKKAPAKFHVPVIPKFDPKVPPPNVNGLRANSLVLPSNFNSTSSNIAGSTLFQSCSGKNQMDQEILNNFLKKYGYDSKKPPDVEALIPMEVDEDQTKMNIIIAQGILTQCDNKINEMSSLRSFMETNVDLISDYEWEIKNQKLEILRKEILEILHPLVQQFAIEALLHKMMKKQANRAWVHKLNATYRNEKEIKREDYAQRKDFVDEWFAKLEQLRKEKSNRELEKRAATDLLKVVKRRIKDTKYFLVIFFRLKELNLAQTVAEHNSSQAAEDFSHKMSELKTIWENLLVEYEEEKITLETIIERRIFNEPLPPTPKTIESQWLEVIFGSASIYDTRNPYLIAERDLNNFITIRTLWDKYLVPEHAPMDDGSSIPIFWALPSPNPTSAWKEYLQAIIRLDEI
ncbi:hypothetical protein DMENIID0001_024210 [Sergentomyia squamirostris]